MTSLIKSQTNSCNLIYVYYKLFDRAKEANIYAIKSRRLRLQILSFLHLSNIIFNASKKHFTKNTVEEELDDIDIDDIENLEDLS